MEGRETETERRERDKGIQQAREGDGERYIDGEQRAGEISSEKDRAAERMVEKASERAIRREHMRYI